MEKPYTDEELAEIAENLRRISGFSLSERLDVNDFVERLKKTKVRGNKIVFEECSFGFLKGRIASAEPQRGVVRHAKGLFEQLRRGSAQAALVILEEIAHLILHPSAKVLDHAVGTDFRAKRDPTVARMEEEARKFVNFLFAPISEVYGIKDSSELVMRFGMPEQAANDYFADIQATRRRTERRERPLPANVIDFLARRPPTKPRQVKAVSEKSFQTSAMPGATVIFESARPGFIAGQRCPNCGLNSMRVEAGCKRCTSCGEEDGCN